MGRHLLLGVHSCLHHQREGLPLHFELLQNPCAFLSVEFVIQGCKPLSPSFIHYWIPMLIFTALCHTSLELFSTSFVYHCRNCALKTSFADLLVLTSRGCNLSVVPAGTSTTTIPCCSSFSRGEVVVWQLKLSIITRAFCDRAPVFSDFLDVGEDDILEKNEGRFLHWPND